MRMYSEYSVSLAMYARRTPRSGSLKPRSFNFNLKHASMPRNKVFFHLYNKRVQSVVTDNSGSVQHQAYTLRDDIGKVFRPGCRHAAHSTDTGDIDPLTQQANCEYMVGLG